MSRSPEAAAPAAAVHELLLPRLSGRWILLIDGRSGSGKSTFAGWLAARTGASVLAMEDLYQGWGGLDAAAELLATRILPALAAGRAAEWRTWDWAADRPGPSRWTVPDGPLIVEGCGALTRASRRWASAAVVLDVQDAVRHARIRRRDSEDALPGHRRWAVQERRQQVRELPQALADVVARGGVRLPEGGQDMRSAVGASVEG